RDQVTEWRLETVLVDAMKVNNADMWVVTSRYNDEDPVIRTLLPQSWNPGLERSVLVFIRNGNKVIRNTLTDGNYNNLYRLAYGNETITQFKKLDRLITIHNPTKVLMNYSELLPVAD